MAKSVNDFTGVHRRDLIRKIMDARQVSTTQALRLNNVAKGDF